MKRILLACFYCLILNWCKGQTHQIDTDQSFLQWTGSAAIGGYKLSGTLQVQKGALTLEGDSLLAAMIEVEMGTLKSKNRQLQDHLRSEDFFDVVRFPLASFVLNKPINTRETGEEMEVIGDLTIKQTSQPISLSTQIIREAKQLTLKGLMKIDRTQHGITYNSPSFFANLKDQAIADEFELEFRLIFR